MPGRERAGFWLAFVWVSQDGADCQAVGAYWQQARTIAAGDYLLAVEDLQRVSRAAAGFLSRYDVWLTPTLGAPPPLIGELVGTDDDPLRGARHAGRFGDEATLVRLAGQLERARPWTGHCPAPSSVPTAPGKR